MEKILLVFLCSFAVAMVIMPIFIFCMKKVKAKQIILSYVEQHKTKVGIPTMGGFVFLLSSSIVCAIFWQGEKTLAIVALTVTLVYGGIGALDDGIKVFFKRNLGLKAYQKIISQSVIAILVSLFLYRNHYVGSEISIPIFNRTFDISWGYLPLCFLALIATSNCVNLTDGLDGLAGTTVTLYLGAIAVIILGIFDAKSNLGQTFYAQELNNLLVFASALIGGIVAFLWFNSHKAKVFMGDTGSLALGGACAILPLMIKNPLIIAIVGIMFVVSGISVIVQVLVFKIKKKRVFLMAPLHHHLEMKGHNESKIVSFYSIITAIAGIIAIIIT